MSGRSICRPISARGRTPHVRLRAEPIVIKTDKAVSIGMVVTELVTNAVKYAYPSGDGEVRVLARREPDGGVILSVEDDGIGFQASGEALGTGLGGKIIAAMARSLGTTLSYEPAAGTRAVLRLDAAMLTVEAAHPG